MKYAVFGGGCFWCIHAIFKRIAGVIMVESGYAGGSVPNPNYQQVCSGLTGHAEVIRIAYSVERIHYMELLEIFWKAHDPTTLNRQGADTGTQYRSIILYTDEEQKQDATTSMHQQARMYSNSMVTEIVALEEFYPAEKYHQDYYEKNPGAGYCTVIITPKLRVLGLSNNK